MIQIQTECMLLVDIVCLGIIVFLLERGTAMYRQTPFLSSYPCCISGRGIEITVLRAAILPDVTIVVQVRQLHNLNYGNSGTLFFLLVWFFFFFFLFFFFWFFFWGGGRGGKTSTSDYGSTIDHVYTNLPRPKVTVNI